MHDDINTKRTELANQMAAAGAAALDFNATAAVLAAIPDTEPQQYVAAGTPENIAAILPATISPARRMRHGDRPTEALVFDEPAATSGDAPADEQWMFDLAAECESRGAGLYGPITFTAQQLPNFVQAVIARIERAAAPAPTCDNEMCEGGHIYNTEHTRSMPCPKCAASGATASGDELPVAWMKPDEIDGLLKAASEDVPTRHYGRIYARQYDADMVPVSRAAVSAATKPTADLTKLVKFAMKSDMDGAFYMGPHDDGKWVKLEDVQSLLATKPAGAQTDEQAKPAPLEHPDKVAATITVKLRADSGYSADQQQRISANQWGQICAILTGKVPAAPAAPTAAPADHVRNAARYEYLVSQYPSNIADALDCGIREIGEEIDEAIEEDARRRAATQTTEGAGNA
ncbi:MAG: hypothetical protein AB1807_11825 [Pseudomonadota bacterium]